MVGRVVGKTDAIGSDLRGRERKKTQENLNRVRVESFDSSPERRFRPLIADEVNNPTLETT